MQNYTRLVGIDVGTKRIGIAQTDLLQTFAIPVGTFSPDQIIQQLKNISDESKIAAFIVGWPLTSSGEEGTSTVRVQEFINRLKRNFPEISIIKMDERYSSNQAMEVMIKAGVPKKKRREKERVDRIAAALILERYLEMNT